MSDHAASLRRRPRVGLALGGGAARGWAHLGVLRGLEDAGLHADLVCGTSIGALVAAAYAAGELDRFERWVLGMLAVLASSVNIMQVRITRSRMAGDPPAVLVSPRLAQLSLFDFHRGREAIAEGRRAVAAVLPDLQDRGLIAR